MTLRWENLEPFEQVVATHAMTGRPYDTGWRLRLKPTLDNTPEELSDDAGASVAETPGTERLAFWRRRLETELAATPEDPEAAEEILHIRRMIARYTDTVEIAPEMEPQTPDAREEPASEDPGLGSDGLEGSSPPSMTAKDLFRAELERTFSALDRKALPSVRGEFLRALLLGRVQTAEGAPAVLTASGLHLTGIRIKGRASKPDDGSWGVENRGLDLAWLCGPSGGYLPALVLTHCLFEQTPRFTGLKCHMLSLEGSVTPGIEAASANFQTGINLNGLCIWDAGVDGAAGRQEDAAEKYKAWDPDEEDRGEEEAGATIDLSAVNCNGDINIRGLNWRRPVGIKLTILLAAAKVDGDLNIHFSAQGYWNSIRTHSPVMTINAEKIEIASNMQLWRLKIDTIELTDARINRSLLLGQSRVRQFSAIRVRIGGNFDIASAAGSRRTHIAKLIQLIDASIGGSFSLGHALIGPKDLDQTEIFEQFVLRAEGLTVQGDLRSQCFAEKKDRILTLEINGGMYLMRTRIGRDLDLAGANIRASIQQGVKDAAILGVLTVGGGLRLEADIQHGLPFTADSEIDLSRSEIAGWLALRGARLENGSRSFALDMFMSRIGGGIYLRSQELNGRIIPGLEARGGVRLASSVVGSGGLDARGAKLLARRAESGKAGSGTPEPLDHVAFDLSEAEIKGPLLCTNTETKGDAAEDGRFTSHGAILLGNAHIAGDLDFRGARLVQDVQGARSPRTDPADRNSVIVARGARIDGSVRLSQGLARDGVKVKPFSAIGRIGLDQATIGHDLDLTGGDFSHCQLRDADDGLFDDTALSLRNATIGGDLIVADDFSEPPSRAVMLWSLIILVLPVGIAAAIWVWTSTLATQWLTRWRRWSETGAPVRAATAAARSPLRNGWFDLTGAKVRSLVDKDGLGWGALPVVRRSRGGLCGAALRLDGFDYERFGETEEERASGARGARPMPSGTLARAWILMVLLNLGEIVRRAGHFIYALTLEPIIAIIMAPFRALAPVWPSLFGRRPGTRPTAHNQVWRRRNQWLERKFVGGRYHQDGFFPSAYEMVEKAFERGGEYDAARRIAISMREAQLRCWSKHPLEAVFSGLYLTCFGAGFSVVRATWTFIIYFLCGLGVAAALKDQGLLVVSGAADSRPCSVDPFAYTVEKMLPSLSLGTKGQCVLAEGRSVDLGWGPLHFRFDTLQIGTGLIIYAILGALVVALTVLTWTGVLRRSRPSGG